MKLVVLVAVLGMTGCDSLFSLVHVPEPDGDAQSSDGRDRDATFDSTPDAKPCTPVGHDEDSDTIDDACDSCLSDPNEGIDTDGDGVDNSCDLDLAGNKDTVLFATGFLSQNEFATGFVASGTVVFESSNNGRVTVFENAVLMMRTAYTPTRILVRTSQVGEGVCAQVDINHSNTTCEVLGSDCNKSTTGFTCLRATGGANGTITMGAANVRTIEMRGPTTIQCRVETMQQTAAAGSTGMFTKDSMFFSTTAGGAVIINSIEIFGTQ
jgi:hypothetical protein